MKSYPLDDFIDLIDRSQSILQIAHVSPDGDTLGSNLALRRFLIQNGFKTKIVCAHHPAEQYSFLADIETIATRFEPAEHDLIIAVDVADLEKMTGFFPEYADFFKRTPLINIDHHPTNNRYGKIAIVDPKAASVGQIMFYILSALGVEFDSTYATYLMTALYFDTGSFQHSNTTKAVMSAAAELMQHDAHHETIAYELFRKKKLAMLQLWGRALLQLKVDKAQGLAWAFISQDDFNATGTDYKDIEGLIALVHGIPGIKMTVILSERENGTVKGSIRTADDVDASYVASVFGGGGHQKAAGFSALLAETVRDHSPPTSNSSDQPFSVSAA